MASKKTQSETSETPSRRRGRKALPADPRNAFEQIVEGRSGPVVRTLDAIQSLGRISRSTCPSPDGEGRVLVDYSETDVELIETAIMSAIENAFNDLREGAGHGGEPVTSTVRSSTSFRLG